MNSETMAQRRSNGSRTIRVLMADPDESLLTLYRERLLQDGVELAVASNGLECLARLRRRPPDVLVLEPQLPWGGGEGVLAIMGEIPRLANIPVMVLTSCREPRLLEAVSRFPVSDYQLKPLAHRSAGGKAPQHTRSSKTAFHFGRTERPPGMCDHPADWRPRPGPARRDG